MGRAEQKSRGQKAAATIASIAAVALGATSSRPVRAQVELDRLRREATLSSSAALEVRLRSPERAVRLAAIAAAPAVPDAAELLAELSSAASGWDRSLAAPAAHAARAIARSLAGSGPPRVDARAGEPAELDDELLIDAIDRWRALALDGERWADVRVDALEIVVALTALRAQSIVDVAPAYDLSLLASDADPEVRRAAMELVAIPAPPSARATLAAAIARDPSTMVRLAAAQALCADLPRDADAVLAALGDDGAAELRALVAPPERRGVPAPAAGAAAIDAARCLAADDDPASRRALDGLRARLPHALRETLAAVIDDVRGRAAR